VAEKSPANVNHVKGGGEAQNWQKIRGSPNLDLIEGFFLVLFFFVGFVIGRSERGGSVEKEKEWGGDERGEKGGGGEGMEERKSVFKQHLFST